MIQVKHKGKAFGDAVLASLFTHILIDNGIDACFACDSLEVYSVVDCPLWHDVEAEYKERGEKFEYDRYSFLYRLNESKDILSYHCDKFLEYWGKDGDKGDECFDISSLDIKRDHVPVKYREIPDIDSVDVAMTTSAGNFTPYKDWPYFNELKEKLDKVGVSFIDLDEHKIRNMKFLNYIKKCKLYLGLDTGSAHLASQFANGKTLILQSGYCDFDYWTSGIYDYDYINVDVECSPCFLTIFKIRRGNTCDYDHKCMKKMSVEKVYKSVMEKLNNKENNNLPII